MLATASLVMSACTSAPAGRSTTTSAASSTSSTAPGARQAGGTVTFALPPTFAANYIFPMEPPGKFGTNNAQYFSYLMFRPLYWFGTSTGKVAINEELSLADPPVWSADGRTVTIHLKAYKWSDGQPVTARDVEFWHNLMKVEAKKNWGAYVAGGYPDNVTSTTVVNPTTVAFHLDKAYNHNWFLYNELSQVIPIPQHAWDRTSASGPVGNYDTTAAGVPAVYNFLNTASNSLSTYTTNPLWKVVDGPFELSRFAPSSGAATFVPNPAYSGPVKATIAKFVEQPFTSDSAEYNVVTSGRGPDVGYVPYQDARSQTSRIASLGYSVSPWILFSFNYFQLNLNDSTYGPVFKQLYVRQALQRLMDQPAIVKGPYQGYAVPTYGPVPVAPANGFVSSFERSNPYPYSVAKARDLLTSHGWTITSGVATCTKPGTGSARCGPGVASGTKMTLNLQYASGISALDQEMAAYKSAAAQAGIRITLSTAPFATVIGNATPCSPGPKCTWQMENWGGGWVYSPDFYPTGGELYSTGAGSNYGSYADPKMDQLISATHTASASQAQAALTAYQDYAATQLPGVIWQPEPDYQITLIKHNLHGVTPQNPYGFITPENFYFTK